MYDDAIKVYPINVHYLIRQDNGKSFVVPVA